MNNLKTAKGSSSPPRLFFGAALVFFARGLATAQVALGFVFLQNGADLLIKPAVDVFQHRGHILVNRAFADLKFCGGVPYGCLIAYNISSQRLAAIFFYDM